jgi:hypothetical protein
MFLLLGLKRADKSAGTETEAKPLTVDKENAIKKNITILITFGLFVFYMFALAPLGFILSSIIYVFLQMLVLSVKPSIKQVVVFALISIAAPILSHYLFVNFFTLMLPRGTLW